MPDTFQLRIGDSSLILILVGDITRQQTGAIVNAANSSLMGGGGVDGAIHRAGGPAILEECKKVVAERGPLPAGEAVATTAGNMRTAYVIHTVGPIWRGGKSGEPEVLARCYENSITLADQMRLTSIAFPAISTGVYGYPANAATDVALAATIRTLSSTRHLHEIHFVVFDERMFDVYTNAAESFAALHKYSTHRFKE